MRPMPKLICDVMTLTLTQRYLASNSIVTVKYDYENIICP